MSGGRSFGELNRDVYLEGKTVHNTMKISNLRYKYCVFWGGLAQSLLYNYCRNLKHAPISIGTLQLRKFATLTHYYLNEIADYISLSVMCS